MKIQVPPHVSLGSLSPTAARVLRDLFGAEYEKAKEGLVTAPSEADFRVAQGQAQALKAVTDFFSKRTP